MSKAYVDCSDIKTNLGANEFSIHILSQDELVIIHDALKLNL